MAKQDNQEQGTVKIVSYDAFVYNHQFQRKIPIGWYFVTRKGMLGILISLGGFLFAPPPYTQYVMMAGVVYIALSFLKTKLIFTSKLNAIEKNKWVDEKFKSILVFSKISWAFKNYYGKRSSLKLKLKSKQGKKNEY